MEELSAEVNKVSSIYSISTDYARILKVLMVSKIVPLKRILSYQFVDKLFLA